MEAAEATLTPNQTSKVWEHFRRDTTKKTATCQISELNFAHRRASSAPHEHILEDSDAPLSDCW